MAALQQYEQSSQQYETYCTEEKLDELFLEASQLLVNEPLDNSMVVKPSGKQQVDFEPLDNPDTKMSTPAVNHWLQRFVIEVRKVSGECYSPDSLHQIGCGVQTAQWVCVVCVQLSTYSEKARILGLGVTTWAFFIPPLSHPCREAQIFESSGGISFCKATLRSYINLNFGQ